MHGYMQHYMQNVHYTYTHYACHSILAKKVYKGFTKDFVLPKMCLIVVVELKKKRFLIVLCPILASFVQEVQ